MCIRDREKCDGLDPKQCRVCLKLFTTQQGKWKHTRYVKCSPPPQPPLSPPTLQNNGNIDILNMDNSVNIDNSVHNNNLHIHIPCNFDQISKETIHNIVKELNQSEYMRTISNNLESGQYVVPRTMNQIYFNDKFPNMQVLKKERRNDNMVEVHVGNGVWEKRMADDVSKTLMGSVEDYHTPYVEHMGDKYKHLEVGTPKWKRIMRPLKTFGNTMLWFDGYKGDAVECIGIQLNYPDEDDKEDEKERKKRCKSMSKLINENIYNNSKSMNTIVHKKINLNIKTKQLNNI